ncbi:YecA family protein [Saccharibacillus alkalitolerans]|uniref:YecA family protein n=1 Tax=Saccharibacillus alkalitolerans TaxID=2705290 RepID=UPI001F1912FF|nr:SEC-C metal-binding domain-containing protein [Saccharibacillus alkalitolerans]
MNEKIEALKDKLQLIDTRSLLGMISVKFATFGDDSGSISESADIFNKTNLMSPQKQYVYLAGLLMSTNYTGIERLDDENTYAEIEENVQEITLEYVNNFIKPHIPFQDREMEEINRSKVALEAFTSYFDTGILRYAEQTEDLIQQLYRPFNKELEELTGLTIDDYMSFFQLVEDTVKSDFEQTDKAWNDITSFLDDLSSSSESVEDRFQRLLSVGNGPLSKNLVNALEGINILKYEKVVQTFGEQKADKLLEYFSLRREDRGFLYYNSPNPFAERPLCWIEEQQSLFVVHPQFILTAIFDFITETLEKPSNAFAEKYKRIKGETVERLFLGKLKDIFGEKATYYTSVCEERGTKEHDILIEYENYILVAEVKASKVREPFFDAERSFRRIKDHFKSASGIGGAYAQAINLKNIIEAEDTVTLYNEKFIPFTINDTSKKIIIPIVLTLNQFGSLAINTSLLLDKEINEPFPWVCNLHDLENIVRIHKYLNKNINDFISYITWRIQKHEVINSSDELDIVEQFYLSPEIENVEGHDLLFWPTGPSLIDKIYFESKGIPYSYPLQASMPKKKKIGRNEPCPCNSGKKFKKCCGKSF